VTFFEAVVSLAGKNLFYGWVQDVLLVENQPRLGHIAPVEPHGLPRFEFGAENAHLFLDFAKLP
jgi:hypothetical protein